MMIPDEKKEEIREAADLVEVVGDYVRLKRAGSGYVGLCPFHDEKTPSFHVTPNLGIYKCFGCGESGDVFNFVMEMEGVGFQEALQTLADRYGISLPQQNQPGESEEYKLREGIYHALRFAGLYYHRQLMELDEAQKARDYLEKRGYNGDIIKKFGLGYAPSSGDSLYKAAIVEGIKEEYLVEADLIKPSQRNEGFYDAFRGRLMFPIFNPSGKLIAFAGRILGHEKSAKYINSAQTPVYNKSSVVYGVNFSKNDIRKHEEVILVEGYTDVITMHKHNIKNVVASSGTSLTSGQIKILQRYGNKLVMIYDSDSAGQTAMKRGTNIALKEGMDVYLLELPEGEDPDSYVKQFGKESFEKLKQKEAEDFITFSIHQAEKNQLMNDPAGITNVIHSVLESIAQIPDELSRQINVQHLHQLTQKYRNSSDRELFLQLNKILRDNRSKEKKNPGQSTRVEDFSVRTREGIKAVQQDHPKKRKMPHYEMELIRLLLQFGRSMQKYIGQNCNEKLFEDDELRAFYVDIMNRYQSGEDNSIEHYSHREEPFPKLLGDIVLEKYTASERILEKTGQQLIKDRNPVKTAKSTLATLQLHHLERLRIQFSERMKTVTGEARAKQSQLLIKTQRQITHMHRSSPDDLFPDPDDGFNKKSSFNETVFEYKMKTDKNES
ncbi:MAG: DNA primase [Balneolaceae bacterium]